MFSRKKFIACLCAVGIVISTIPLVTFAEERLQPETTECTQQVQEETEATEAKLEETEPVETESEETTPEETTPEETNPEETAPEETIPEETVPDETIPTEPLPGERRLSEVLAEQKGADRICIAEDVVADESTTIPESVELVVEAGNIRIPGTVTLTISCYAEIKGGTLVVENGGSLVNMGFITVKENGKLLIADDAEYAQDEGAVLHLEKVEDGEESIVGISSENMECTVYVTTVNKLIGALGTNSYAYLTIIVDDPDIVSAAGITEIPDNVCICRGA